jgi:hypothetical protein
MLTRREFGKPVAGLVAKVRPLSRAVTLSRIRSVEMFATAR